MPSTAERLEVRVLGPLRVSVGGQELTTPSSGRARALLGYLALRPGPIARAEVAADLWPDVMDGSARASLRSAVWSLRRALGEAASARVAADRSAIGLVDDGSLWVDAGAFGDALACGRYEAALDLCRGPLLQGVSDEWALVERDVFADRVGEALGALTDDALRRGDTAAAVRWARRRARQAPLDETAARSLIVALEASGDSPAALQELRRVAERLRRGLGVAPSAEMRRMARRLRRPLAATGPETNRPAVVGRTSERALLDAERARLLSGQGGVIVIRGEAGIGKTTLAGELLWRIGDDGLHVAACSGRMVGRPAPYEQWTELARGLEVTDGICVPADIPPSDLAAPAQLRSRLREAAVERLEQLVLTGGLAMQVDDAHTCDPWSLELLGYACRRLRDAPMLIVMTRRTVPRAPDLDSLLLRLQSGVVTVTQLELQPLRPPILAQLVRSGARLDEEGVHEAVLLGDGNPLVALQCAWALERGQPATVGLRGMARAAVGALDGSARDLVELIAVAGGALTNAALLDLRIGADVEAALASGLLVADEGIRFRHGLLREIIYDEIAAPRRALLHTRAAEVASEPAERARHLLLGGRQRLALGALAEAADHALAVGAVDEATEVLREALLIDDSDPGMHLRLARAEAWRGDAKGARRSLERALVRHDPRDHSGLSRVWLEAAGWYRSSLCDPSQTRHAARQALRYAGEDAHARADALAAAAWAAAMLGAVDEAEQDARAAAMLDRDQRLAFDLALVRAHLLIARGHPEASLDAFADAAAAIRPIGRPDLAYSVWLHAAAVAAFAGDLLRALWYVERGLEEAGRIPLLRIPSLASRGYVLARLGRVAEARADGDRQLQLAVERADAPVRAVAEHDAGMIALATGDNRAAVARLTIALELNAAVSRPVAYLARAEAHARLGAADAADADLRHVVLMPLRSADAPDALVPRLTRVQGLAAAARGDEPLARRRLEEAAVGWRRLLARPAGAPLEAWVANILDLGRPPAAGLVEPARELERTLIDIASLTAEAGS